MEKILKKCAVLLAAIILSFTAYADPYDTLYEGVPFDMPRVALPDIPDRIISLAELGGVGDGLFDNTPLFEKAMVSLAGQGGGRLIVPAGIWSTGPIVFRSNIEMHLEKGALIVFSDDKDLYQLIPTFFEGLETVRCQSPISGWDLNDIAITGEGTIDGSGEAWRPLKKEKVPESIWRQITSRGGVFKRPDYWMPSEGYLKGDSLSDMNVPRDIESYHDWREIRDFLRPVMVSFVGCRNVLLQGVTFQNSPSWNLHPLMCENVIIDNVKVRNPSYAQNGDGLDLESCRNVLVVDSWFDVGDDGICIKSGKDEQGRRRAMPTENVIISNCRVFKGHGGFVVGSEMSGGVRNIWVVDCSFLGTDVGLRFKSRRGRGGVVENIYIENITMTDIVTDSFSFNLFYGGQSAVEALEAGSVDQAVEEFPVTDETPAFRNIFVRNVVSRNSRSAMNFRGLPEMNIGNIVVENSVFTARYGATLSYCDGVTFRNVRILPTEGRAVTRENVKNFREE